MKVEDHVIGKQDVVQDTGRQSSNGTGRYLSGKAVKWRQRFPTVFQNGRIVSSMSVARQRRKETFQVAQEIHGGSAETSKPGAVGLLDTALVKCSPAILVEGLSVSKKFKKSVMPTIFKKALTDYEGSDENMVRSVSVYYSGGVCGKQKYRKIYKDSCYKTSSNSGMMKSVHIAINRCPIPRLVPYNRLMPFIKSIPQGKINNVYETLCYDLKEGDKVHGCYRNLDELLITLASFYLSGFSGQTLTWFGNENTFLFSLGGDGAPFGKHDTSCAWLVGILNTGKGILSSSENYLLFGANCAENCVPVQRYVNLLLSSINRIEKSTFPCTYTGSDGPVTVNVKFKVGELPNDMKMICFLSGELTNSAKFFSSFANVSADLANDAKGTFGIGKQNTWQPWRYSFRISVANSVETFKKEIAKQKVSDSTKRSKVTTFIANKKSRQEFIPPLGLLINKIHVEPLHLKNNACALAHRYLLNEVLLISNISCSVKSFSHLQSTSAFAKYVLTMKRKCQLSRLANKIIKWFNECRSDGKTFDYRFTGKDSRLFLHNFMFLIAAVNPFARAGSKEQYMLHVLAYTCLTLRSCVSLFSRINISDEQLNALDRDCRQYFLLHCLFFFS